MSTGRFLIVMMCVLAAHAAAAAHPTVHVSTTHIDAAPKPVQATPFGGVLYDQMTTESSFGAFVDEVPAPAAVVGNTSIGADDFVVDDVRGWTVNGFAFNAYGRNDVTPSPISLRVYTDDGGHPSSTAVCSAENLAVDFDGAPANRLNASLPAPCNLAPGSYWVAWSFDDADLATGPWGWWGRGTTLHNAPAVRWNAGSDLTASCQATWSTFADCGTDDSSLQDFGFSVLGHVTSGASGLSLTLGVAPYEGDPNECGSDTDIEVNVGDQVNLCYTLTNNSAQTLAYQSIVDSVDGAILTFDPTPIPSGESHQYVRTITATTDTTRSATWTGYVNLAGYAYDDTATPDFVDISATGTDLGFIAGDGNDSEFTLVTPGFPIRFYDQTSTVLCISNDGFIGYDDAVCTSPGAGSNPDPGFSFNQELPTTNGVNGPTFLAPMWSDLGDGPGNVYVQTLGDAPNRKFVVQWNNIATYAIATSGATFEVVFDEASDTIRYEYLATEFGNPADNGAWATVGLQGDPNGLFTQYSYYDESLHANMAIEWTYTPAVSASADSGSVTVSAGDPTLAVAETSLSAVVTPEGSATRTLTVENTGNRDLHWDLGEAPGGATQHFPKTSRYVAQPAASVDAPTPGTSFASMHAPIPSHMPVRSPSGGEFSVPAYAISSLLPGLETFDALDPAGTMSPITMNSDWIYSATFVGNDFSKLYVIDNDSFEVQPGSYGTIDTTTGELTVIGPITGAESTWWSGMSEDPLTGVVYAVNYTDTFGGSANATLYSINLSNGRATRIGPIDGPGVNPIRYISGIAISPAGLMYGIDLYGQSLIAIDKTSGAASVIESLGLNVQFIQDLAFDPSTGDLYWAAFYIDDTGSEVGELRVLDPLSAASQAIGQFPPAGEYPFDEISALAIAKPSVGCSAPGDVPWLSLSPTSGTIAAGDAPDEVTVSLDASGLAPGLHQATVCVFSDDPRHQAIAVPVALAVSESTPLYDQSVGETDLRAFNNTIVTPAPAAGLSSEGADDFVVDENGWSVTGFQFSAYGNNGNPLPSSVNVRVMADDGNGRPATDALCSASGVPTIAVDGVENAIGVWLTDACDLPVGTYWVAWSFADVDISSPILGFWGQSTEQHNQPAVWRNPGGMLSAGCTEWSTFDQCPDQFDASAQDFGFSVFGSADTVDCTEVIFGDGFDGDTGGCSSKGRSRN
jgi:hypothetical protein